MNIGGIDRRVKIQNYSTNTNLYGELMNVWQDYATVWAQIERKPAAVEQNSAEQIVSVNKVVFVIRYSSVTKLVKPKHRIEYDSKYYNILGVHELGRKDRIRLITEIIE